MSYFSIFNVVFSGKDSDLALPLSLSISLLKTIRFPGGKFDTIYPETDTSFFSLF